jgi:hypothetical protein
VVLAPTAAERASCTDWLVFDDASVAPRQDAFAVATSVWTGLHGIVSLRLSKPGFPWPPVEVLHRGASCPKLR